MQPVVTAAEMRNLDRRTIDDIGLPEPVLMENAGRAVAHIVDRAANAASAAAAAGVGKRVALLVGPGNNGGDGVVAARTLLAAGLVPTVLLVADRNRVGNDAKRQLDLWERCGGSVVECSGFGARDSVLAALQAAQVVVDAIFGIGFERELDPWIAEVVRLANAAPGIRVAVDLPTGLHADRGSPIAGGPVFAADVTVTFAAAKIGLVTAPGFSYCGRVDVVDIGIPRHLLESTALGCFLYGESDARSALPRGFALEHKGDRGHVAVIAGGLGMRGAGHLAAQAAARAGAGLVTWLQPGAAAVPAADHIMTRAVQSADQVDAFLQGKVIAIGPGLGTDDLAVQLLERAIESARPIVLDADALTQLADRDAAGARVGARSADTVLTPHPKEAARLLATSADAIAEDRIAAARELARRYGAVAVLKGARTVVCDGRQPGQVVRIIHAGSPALATGGSGDVLCGVIAALIAQGLPAVDAACCGAWLHGRAGEQLATTWGQRGAVATDLPDEVARVSARLTAP